MEALLKWGLVAMALLAAGPTVSGYVWALGWLPAYGAMCQYDKVFGSAITPDGYRVFLLGYGCDVGAAIGQIVAAYNASRNPKDASEPPDPARIIAIYQGLQRADTPEESLTTDLVQRRLRDFADSQPSTSECQPGAYCGLPDRTGENTIQQWIAGYSSYARSHFLDAVDDGADGISWMLRLGRGYQALVCVLYVVTALAIARLCLTRSIRRRGRR